MEHVLKKSVVRVKRVSMGNANLHAALAKFATTANVATVAEVAKRASTGNANQRAAHAKSAMVEHVGVVTPASVKPVSMERVQPEAKHRVARMRAVLQKPQYAV